MVRYTLETRPQTYILYVYKNMFANILNFCQIYKKILLDFVKKKIARVWRGHVMHIGNMTINMV